MISVMPNPFMSGLNDCKAESSPSGSVRSKPSGSDVTSNPQTFTYPAGNFWPSAEGNSVAMGPTIPSSTGSTGYYKFDARGEAERSAAVPFPKLWPGYPDFSGPSHGEIYGGFPPHQAWHYSQYHHNPVYDVHSFRQTSGFPMPTSYCPSAVQSESTTTANCGGPSFGGSGKNATDTKTDWLVGLDPNKLATLIVDS